MKSLKNLKIIVNKKCSKINITDMMNLLAVTVTLNIQTCIVRLYNVKKNSQHNMYSKKKSKRSILVFQGNSTFLFSLLCSAEAKKNECIGSQAQQHYVKCCHIDKSYCHTEKGVNQFSFSIKL